MTPETYIKINTTIYKIVYWVTLLACTAITAALFLHYFVGLSLEDPCTPGVVWGADIAFFVLHISSKRALKILKE